MKIPLLQKFLWMEVETGVRRTTIVLFPLIVLWLFGIWSLSLHSSFKMSLSHNTHDLEFFGQFFRTAFSLGIILVIIICFSVAIYSFYWSKSESQLLPCLIMSAVTSIMCLGMGLATVILENGKKRNDDAIIFGVVSLGYTILFIYYWIGLRNVFQTYSIKDDAVTNIV